MFGSKFAMHTIGFPGLLEDVNTTNPPSAMRAQGFLQFLSEALTWFEKHPTLNSIKIVSVAKPEVNLETNVDIRIRHHINLTVDGGEELFPKDQDRQDYAEMVLPYKTMGSGVFELRRTHDAVYRYLYLGESEPSRYMGLLQELAYEMDQAFGRVFVYHDFGLASAG